MHAKWNIFNIPAAFYTHTNSPGSPACSFSLCVYVSHSTLIHSYSMQIKYLKLAMVRAQATTTLAHTRKGFRASESGRRSREMQSPKICTHTHTQMHWLADERARFAYNVCICALSERCIQYRIYRICAVTLRQQRSGKLCQLIHTRFS